MIACTLLYHCAPVMNWWLRVLLFINRNVNCRKTEKLNVLRTSECISFRSLFVSRRISLPSLPSQPFAVVKSSISVFTTNSFIWNHANRPVLLPFEVSITIRLTLIADGFTIYWNTLVAVIHRFAAFAFLRSLLSLSERRLRHPSQGCCTYSAVPLAFLRSLQRCETLSRAAEGTQQESTPSHSFLLWVNVKQRSKLDLFALRKMNRRVRLIREAQSPWWSLDMQRAIPTLFADLQKAE